MEEELLFDDQVLRTLRVGDVVSFACYDDPCNAYRVTRVDGETKVYGVRIAGIPDPWGEKD